MVLAQYLDYEVVDLVFLCILVQETSRKLPRGPVLSRFWCFSRFFSPGDVPQAPFFCPKMTKTIFLRLAACRRRLFFNKKIIFGLKNVIFLLKKLFFAQKRHFLLKKWFFWLKNDQNHFPAAGGVPQAPFFWSKMTFRAKKVIFGLKKVIFLLKNVIFSLKTSFLDEKIAFFCHSLHFYSKNSLFSHLAAPPPIGLSPILIPRT